jgi:hypothetical protein
MTARSLALVLAMLAAGAVRAAGGGTTDAGEMDLPSGAAESVFGTAAAGLVDGSQAVFAAPARLMAGAPAGVTATHAQWMEGVSDSTIAVHSSRPGLGSVGLSLRYFRAETRETTEDYRGFFGREGGLVYYENLRLATALSPDLAAIVPAVPPGVTAGLTGFLIRRDAADMGTRYGYGINAQAAYRAFPATDFYVIGRNIGALQERPLPLGFAAGFTGRFPGAMRSGATVDTLSGVAELRWSRQNGPGVALAAEYAVDWDAMRSAVRLGWAIDAEKNASLLPACGLAFRLANLSLEAGLVFLGDLGTAQVITLGWEGKRAE